jgi:hypothetical protein
MAEQAMSEELKKKVAWSADGDGPLAVVRPSKPDVALALAKAALSSQNPEALESLPIELCGPYTFAGWLCREDPSKLLDENGAECDTVQPGDSLVTLGERTS